jgi:hypothetical protein
MGRGNCALGMMRRDGNGIELNCFDWENVIW